MADAAPSDQSLPAENFYRVRAELGQEMLQLALDAAAKYKALYELEVEGSTELRRQLAAHAPAADAVT